MAFRIGQKVVCVDDGVYVTGNKPNVSTFIKRGRIYTVRWIGELPHEPYRHLGLGIRLMEVIRPADLDNPAWDDFPFAAFRFRPVQERKQSTDTGFAILQKILRTTSVEASRSVHQHSDSGASSR